MAAAYRIEWASPARRDLSRLPEKIATAVVEFVYGGLAANPRRVGRALHLELTGFHSARRGDFHVMYRTDTDQRRVIVAAIDHRGAVYRRR